ncbi:MAG TPA: hypothetical protein VLB73_02545 [Patescibacteria group bacterium]|nr:hypothetical protein [Patescibacteria group bacterium]
MNGRLIFLRIALFFFTFSLIFFGVRLFHIFPPVIAMQGNNPLPWLFSATGLMFSIISGFVIQSKWNTWNELIDATHGELSAIRQLHILSRHFSQKVQKEVKQKICAYLALILEESKYSTNLSRRSEQVDLAIFSLEETVFNIDYSQYPNIGSMAFDLVRKIMDFREKRLQNAQHKLPLGVKLFMIVTTYATVFTSLFIGETTLFYDYIFTSIIALLSFGIYMLIDDLDHPYSPGQWHLSAKDYKKLLDEVQADS